MLELVAQDGSAVFINSAAIWHVRSSGTDMTAVYASSGAALFVRGEAKDVAAKVTAALRHGGN